MSDRTLRRIADALSLLVVAAILVGTLSPPGSPTDNTFGLNPNLGHLGLFGALGIVMALRFAVSARSRQRPRSTLVMVFLAFWVLGAGTELLQNYVGRDPSFGDWVFDMIGGTIGFLGGSFALRMLLPRTIGPVHRAAPATARDTRSRGRRARSRPRRRTRVR